MLYNEEEINAIKDSLVQKEETLAVAESVTAGHLQAAFSAGMEASKFFQGGITAYNIGQKARHLHVDPIVSLKVNCVSDEIAEKMAAEVSKMFSSDYGVAITGYASMVPECEKEGIHAFFAISYKNRIILSERLTSFEDIPHDVQVDYAKQVIQKLNDYLKSGNRKSKSKAELN